ncbi:MAG TPA: methylthioribulose 1-phosphate dehydratase [Pyrinomonadaceae bacterium]|nr:methylthioribulose 1-phosphate dehydratase [Pyrinomonadaceae bacterium]
MSESVEGMVTDLALIAKRFYARGWLLGTSGNLSAVVRREPLELAITASGVDKGQLIPKQVLMIDENAHVIKEQPAGESPGFLRSGDKSTAVYKPSDESLIHIRIVKERGAGAVLHTHSVWNTILSEVHALERGIQMEGYEMLKGLDGVRTHEHAEWLPIIENSQDIPALADTISNVLERNPQAHGFLIKRHGLYSWGNDLAQAKRHIEILEFLLETIGRTATLKGRRS